MFGTIRKHQTWLWAIIITLTIISFVIFFSPYSKLNPGRGPANLGSIYGTKVGEEEFIKAQKDAMLQYYFMSGGRWPQDDARQSGYDLERETYQWLMLLRKIEKDGVHISTEMAADVARNMLSQFQRAGIPSAQAFQQQVLDQRGLNLDDFQRFVHNYLAIQELVALYGLGGKLVTPTEARSLWIRENQEVASEAVFFSASNYLASVTVQPAAVAQFFTNHMAEYRLPERMQVKYVEFGISNYLKDAEAELAKTNLDAIVAANLDRIGTNYTRLGKTPEEAKAKIREELIKNRALIEARRAANTFANVIFDKPNPRPEYLDEEAKAKGLQVKTTQPFDMRLGPTNVDGGPNFTKVAFTMDLTNTPLAGPVVGENGVFVLAFDRRLPSEMPSLDQIRDRVTSDYKTEQATSAARRAGVAFHNRLTNSMAQGKAFAATCTEANLKPITMPAIALVTRSLPELGDRMSLNEYKQIVFGTQPGKVSPFEPTSDGGTIVHVTAKLPIDQKKLDTELPRFVDAVRQNRQTEAFNEWFRKEAAVALRDTPVGRPRTQPPDMGAQQPRRKS